MRRGCSDSSTRSVRGYNRRTTDAAGTTVAPVPVQIDALRAALRQLGGTIECALSDSVADLARSASHATCTTVEPVPLKVDALATAVSQAREATRLADARAVGHLAGAARVAARPAVLAIPVQIDALAVALGQSRRTTELALPLPVADLAVRAGVAAGSAVIWIDRQPRLTAVARVGVAVGHARVAELHDSPGPQLAPHAPQWDGSRHVLMHASTVPPIPSSTSQQLSPEPHCPEPHVHTASLAGVQVAGLPQHALPDPQAVSPSIEACVDPQAQLPFTQSSPGPQASPHAPPAGAAVAWVVLEGLAAGSSAAGLVGGADLEVAACVEACAAAVVADFRTFARIAAGAAVRRVGLELDASPPISGRTARGLGTADRISTGAAAIDTGLFSAASDATRSAVRGI